MHDMKVRIKYNGNQHNVLIPYSCMETIVHGHKALFQGKCEMKRDRLDFIVSDLLVSRMIVGFSTAFHTA